MSKNKTYKEIKEALPDINSEKVEVLSDELDRVLSLKKLFDSDGGKELIKVLRNNCVRALNRAVVNARDGEKEQLIANVLDYAANIDLISQVRELSVEEELRDQLDEAVREAME